MHLDYKRVGGCNGRSSNGQWAPSTSPGYTTHTQPLNTMVVNLKRYEEVAAAVGVVIVN